MSAAVIVPAQVGPDVVARPLDERADLHQLEARVMLDDRRCRTGGGLIAPNGSDPRVQPREGAAERLDFAQRAAAIRAPLPPFNPLHLRGYPSVGCWPWPLR